MSSAIDEWQLGYERPAHDVLEGALPGGELSGSAQRGLQTECVVAGLDRAAHSRHLRP